MRTLPIHTLAWSGLGHLVRCSGHPAFTRADCSPLCLAPSGLRAWFLTALSLHFPSERSCPAGEAEGCVFSLQAPGVSCRGAAALRNLGCFWDTAWVKCHESLSPPLRGSSRDWSPSAGWGQLFSLALFDPDPVIYCDGEWMGLGHAARGSWEARQLPCLEGSLCVCASHGQRSVFFGLSTCFGGPPLQPPNGACLFLTWPQCRDS